MLISGLVFWGGYFVPWFCLFVLFLLVYFFSLWLLGQCAGCVLPGRNSTRILLYVASRREESRVLHQDLLSLPGLAAE